MVPLNRDVWREELPVSPPSSRSNSASPPLRLSCTVAACPPGTRTYTRTEPRAAAPCQISAPMTRCNVRVESTCAQSHNCCWNAFKASNWRRERGRGCWRWPGYLSHLFPLRSCQPPSCCGAFKDAHATVATLELHSCFSFPVPSNLL